MRRWTEVQTIAAAARKIRVPSTAAERYSALPCPNSCASSGGRDAVRIARSATTAATRFTPDSMASDSRPTDPVIMAAELFRRIVATAAPRDRYR